MRQNKYDDERLFAGYSAMPRSVGGLDEAGEWHAFRALLPELRDKRVLDLGCGFGWHCRYAREQGARSVVGVDVSTRMLARAEELTEDPRIEYRRAAIEDMTFAAESFDAVISSLALHYVEGFDLVCKSVHRALMVGGMFVLSVEHPIFTALPAQDWHRSPDGELLHWPVDAYQNQGPRRTRWIVDDVIKYHRTVATYVNTLLDAGFRLERLVEPEPSEELLRERPELSDELRRPMFLLLAAVKSGPEPDAPAGWYAPRS